MNTIKDLKEQLAKYSDDQVYEIHQGYIRIYDNNSLEADFIVTDDINPDPLKRLRQLQSEEVRQRWSPGP